MMDAKAAMHPDRTWWDDRYPPADRHAPYVDVHNVELGADGDLPGRAEQVTDNALTRAPRVDGIILIRRAHASGVDSRSQCSQQAREHDLTAAHRDLDRVGVGEPKRRKMTPDVGKRPHLAVDMDKPLPA